MNASDRRGYLGATDVAAIAGVSPYRSPIEVWAEKRGDTDGPEQTKRMRLGQLLEDAIADAYAEQTGRRLKRVSIVRNPALPAYLAGHPDRLVVGERGIVECKASASTRGYSDDDVPPHVRVQATWYCGLTGRDWCDVVLLAHMGIRIVRIEADPDLFADLVTAAATWWQRHIVEGVEPAPDGTDAYRRHLAAKFPNTADVELVATPEQALLLDELRAAKAACDAADEHKTAVENRIRAAMGEASVLIAPGARVTWKAAAKGRVGWQAVAADYRRLIEDAGIETVLYPRDGAPSDFTVPEWLAFIESMHTAEPSRTLRAYFTAQHEEEAA